MAALDAELERRLSALLECVLAPECQDLRWSEERGAEPFDDRSPDLTITRQQNCFILASRTGPIARVVMDGGSGDGGLLDSVPAQTSRGEFMTSERPTAREIDVLRLLSLGHTNRRIADHLFLSEHTVKSHLENLYRKLEVTDRAHAVAEGFRRGLMDAP